MVGYIKNNPLHHHLHLSKVPCCSFGISGRLWVGSWQKFNQKKTAIELKIRNRLATVQVNYYLSYFNSIAALLRIDYYFVLCSSFRNLTMSMPLEQLQTRPKNQDFYSNKAMILRFWSE
jgi:hypothetical protein